MTDQIIYSEFLTSNSLWTGVFEGLEQISLNYNSTEINEIDLPSKMVFGKLMEICFKNQLENNNQFKILLHNHQIIRDKITLGELDFIIQNKVTQKIIHIEMVFKFYLFDDNEIENENWEGWIGPNRRDSLKEKLEKLKNKQLPLLYKPETGKDLLQHNLKVKEIEQQVLFKAQLYVPLKHINSRFEKINIDCIAGTYISKANFLKEANQGSTYFLPEKRYWHILPREDVHYQSFSETLTQIEKLHEIKRSPLIWKKEPNGILQRLFVVFW